jgi:hypothetical protein
MSNLTTETHSLGFASGLAGDLYRFICQKYVQQQDERQRVMGLAYTTAETHDLARTLARWFEERKNDPGF